MALTDTGQPDEDQVASDRAYRAPDPSSNMPPVQQWNYQPFNTESVSPLSPAGNPLSGAIRVAENDANRGDDASNPWIESLKKVEDTIGGDPELKGGYDPLETDQKIADVKAKRKAEIINDLDAKKDQQIMLPQPERAQLPSTPVGGIRSTLANFANPLMLAALLGSGLTRGSAKNAMAAATGLMEGVNARNSELARLNAYKFNGSTKNMISQMEGENAKYEEYFNDPNMSDADKISNAYAVAKGYGDDHMAGYLQKGDLSGAVGLNNHRKQIVQSTLEAHAKHRRVAGGKGGGASAGELSDDEIEALYEGDEKYLPGKAGREQFRQVRAKHEDASQSAFGKKEAGEKTAGRLEAKADATGLERGTEGYDALVDQIGQYRKAPPSAYRMNSANKQLMEDVAKKYPDYDETKFTAKQSGARVTGRAEPAALSATLTALEKSRGIVAAFSSTELKNLDALVKLGEKVDVTGIPIMEKWIRAGRQATGDPDVAEFHTQHALTVPGVARIVNNPNLGSQLTDTAKREVNEAMPLNASVAQLRRIRDRIAADFKNREQGLSEQIARVKRELGIDKPEDDQRRKALEWLQKNPDSPDAPAVRERLGL